METFSFYNPVKLHFGFGICNRMHQILPQYGKKALVVYGQGSVKKFQILPKITTQLSLAGISFVEYGGIKPNPVIEDVKKAADLARKEKVDMIVAVGGGSVIDSAKVISAAVFEKDPWAFFTGEKQPKQALPVIDVLTVVGTGSEMNNIAVIQNNAEQKKLGFRHELLFPKESFLDPSFTISVPKEQTAYGIADIIAHALEAYFGDGNSPLADRFVASVIQEVMDISLKLINDLFNFDLRARIMLAATYALNGTLAIGRGNTGDWGAHAVGHAISVLYDVLHGATLSIAFPAWMRAFSGTIPDRIRALGRLIFNDGCLSTEEVIEKFEEFFKLLGLPTRLSDIGLTKYDKEDIVQLLKKNQATGRVHPMTEVEIEAIGDFMLTGKI